METPNYWRHNQNGKTYLEVGTVRGSNGTLISYLDIEEGYYYHSSSHNFTRLPFPQAGENWKGYDVTIGIESVDDNRVHFVNGLSMNLDYFMRNYSKVEVEEEAPVTYSSTQSKHFVGFKDKLRLEIKRLEEDITEVTEQVNAMMQEAIDMESKRKEWEDMLNAYTSFTDKYEDILASL